MAEYKLYLLAKGTPILEKGFESVFESLSKEKQLELIAKKLIILKRQGYICNNVSVGKWNSSYRTIKG